MREAINFTLDLFCVILRRWLMIYAICGILTEKERFIKKRKQIAAGYVALSTAFYLAASYLPKKYSASLFKLMSDIVLLPVLLFRKKE